MAETYEQKQTEIDWGVYWQDKRYAYSGNDIVYIGLHTIHKAATTLTDWYVWKFSYDASNNIERIEGPLKGAWDSRASLSWA